MKKTLYTILITFLTFSLFGAPLGTLVETNQVVTPTELQNILDGLPIPTHVDSATIASYATNAGSATTAGSVTGTQKGLIESALQPAWAVNGLVGRAGKLWGDDKHWAEMVNGVVTVFEVVTGVGIVGNKDKVTIVSTTSSSAYPAVGTIFSRIPDEGDIVRFVSSTDDSLEFDNEDDDGKNHLVTLYLYDNMNYYSGHYTWPFGKASLPVTIGAQYSAVFDWYGTETNSYPLRALGDNDNWIDIVDGKLTLFEVTNIEASVDETKVQIVSTSGDFNGPEVGSVLHLDGGSSVPTWTNAVWYLDYDPFDWTLSDRPPGHVHSWYVTQPIPLLPVTISAYDDMFDSIGSCVIDWVLATNAYLRTPAYSITNTTEIGSLDMPTLEAKFPTFAKMAATNAAMRILITAEIGVHAAKVPGATQLGHLKTGQYVTPAQITDMVTTFASPNRITKVWTGTQAQYNAVNPKVATTLYVVPDATVGGYVGMTVFNDATNSIINSFPPAGNILVENKDISLNSSAAHYNWIQTPDALSTLSITTQTRYGCDVLAIGTNEVAYGEGITQIGDWTFGAKTNMFYIRPSGSTGWTVQGSSL